MSVQQIGELFSQEVTKDRSNVALRTEVQDTHNNLVINCTPRCLADRDFKTVWKGQSLTEKSVPTLKLTQTESKCLKDCVDNYLLSQQAYYDTVLAAMVHK